MAPACALEPFFPLSLRFRDGQMEAGYASVRRPLLVRRVLGLGLLQLLAFLCALAFFLFTGALRREQAPTDMAHRSFMAEASAQGSLAALSALLLLGRRAFESRLLQRRPMLLEAFVVLAMAWAMCLLAFLGRKRFAKLQGYSLQEVFLDGYDSDSGLLLFIDVYVTCAHLGLPVRWHIMAPLELGAVLLYVAVIAVVGSEEPRNQLFFNVLALCCLTAAAALGKRAAEVEERRAFLAVIGEKERRCQAEFELEQVARSAAGAEEEGRSETDRSGPIFEAQRGKDSREQLRLVAEKGDSEHWRIPASEVRLLSEEALGRGSFGFVQRAVFCGMLVAVKCPRLELGSVRVTDLCNELRILRHLRHPNIVAAHGAVVLPEEGRLYLVLELIKGPKLAAFLLPKDPIKTPSGLQRYQVMLGVCGALLYMHTRRPHIVHGDLKEANIMIELCSGRAVPKVLDFGLSRVINTRPGALGGTLAWMAPEVISGGPARCSADIYSAGHVLAFTATGVPPMQGMSCSMIFPALQRRQPPPRNWPEGCAFGAGYQALVASCLSQQPEKRPSIEEVYRQLLLLSRELRLPSEAYLQQVQQLAELMDSCTLDIKGSLVRSSRAPSQLESLPEEDVPQGSSSRERKLCEELCQSLPCGRLQQQGGQPDSAGGSCSEDLGVPGLALRTARL